MKKIRIGFGMDVHRLEENRVFILGGVLIPHYKGATGHSNADVLLHAICDALLGAANMRDIGFHFPDSSNDYAGIDSAILLQNVVVLIKEKGFEIGNIDCTIALQTPKIASFIPKMKEKIAAVVQIAEEDISIKATTTERLGFEGREEGVTAYCVALIYQN
ncbi:MAG: 2-C-methyl-D-erythritol 2,4-cyclodiphosphate synthase [Bacteroidales bacterium]|nr:2-C-methyl-D-erythritol 2,4-cyclodiphosphate synthase [Bacteroidales bacterium]